MNYAQAMKLGARCDLCPLRDRQSQGLTKIVPPAPNLNKLRLIIVGEGPGRNEEKMRLPFVGQSGKLLNGLLAKNQIDRKSAWVTNAALCRGETDKDNDAAALCCAPRLLREIEPLDPKVPILTLGKTAGLSILGTKKLFFARGFVWTTKNIHNSVSRSARKAAQKTKIVAKAHKLILKAETLEARAKIAGRTVFPTIHPAFVLRSDTWAPILEIDVRRLGRYLRGELQGLEDGASSEEAGSHFVGGPNHLRGLGPVVSIDVETNGVKPLECKLLCVGLSDGKKTVVLWPWRGEYAKPLSQFLRSRKAVVAHNGYSFDQIVLVQHGVK